LIQLFGHTDATKFLEAGRRSTLLYQAAKVGA